ncbi:MAG: hypothetical protein ABIV36_07865 [Sphingobium limneticum]
MVEEWVEEWLFRGRPPSGPGSDMPRDYQVMIGWQAPATRDPSKLDRGVEGPYTPAQAEALGHSITSLVEGVNAAAIEDVAMLTSQLAQSVEYGRTVDVALKAAKAIADQVPGLELSMRAAGAQIAALEVERNGLADAIAARDAEIAGLTARIAEMDAAAIQPPQAEAV